MEVLSRCVSASVLILLILLLRRILLYRLPKGTFMALWWTALLKLLLPVSLPSRFSIYNVSRRLYNAADGSNTAFIGEMTAIGGELSPVVGEAANLPAAEAAIPLLPCLWAAGVLITAAFFLVSYIKCRAGFRFALPFEGETGRQFLQQHFSLRKISIKVSNTVRSPLTFGLLRPVILLPEEAENYTETELLFVLEHEYRHIRRLDGLTKGLLAAAASLYWFLLPVWAMYFAANRDIELWCDEKVLGGNTGLRAKYALSLLALEEKKSKASPVFNGFCKNGTEERIRAIMKTRKYTLPMILAAILLVVGVSAGFATAAEEKSVLEENISSESSLPELLPITVEDTTEAERLVQLVLKEYPAADGGFDKEAALKDAGEENLLYYLVQNLPGVDEQIILSYAAEGLPYALLQYAKEQVGTIEGEVAAALLEGYADETVAAEQWHWPVEGCYDISSGFGEKVHHDGTVSFYDRICITGQNAHGRKVVAALSGTVTEAEYHVQKGWYVKVKHAGDYETEYRHLAEVLVEKGDQVANGRQLGTVGTTGQVTGPCLSFAVFFEGEAVDPMGFYSAVVYR